MRETERRLQINLMPGIVPQLPNHNSAASDERPSRQIAATGLAASR